MKEVVYYIFLIGGAFFFGHYIIGSVESFIIALAAIIFFSFPWTILCRWLFGMDELAQMNSN